MSPLQPFRLASAPDLAVASEIVIAGEAVALPTSIVWSNMDICGDPHFASKVLNGCYRARTASMDPVAIALLPPGATLLSGNSFMVVSEGALVAEQVSPLTGDPNRLARERFQIDPEPIEIEAECLLLCRYGESVWGHWLGEILPRAIVAETAYPGRFTYVIASQHPAADGGRNFSTAVFESLAAYGIGPDRLLQVEIGRNYSFDRLSLVCGIWSNAILNPGTLRLMRSEVRAPIPKGRGERIAILRRDTRNRTLFNSLQISELLAERGFMFAEMCHLSFTEQVGIFREADCVFGVLGSGLTSLIYSPDHVRVITAAPADWFDFYFYMLIQSRKGLNAEVRGSSVWSGSGERRDAPIVIDPVQLAAALDRVEAISPEQAPGMIHVANTELPRWLGPCLMEIDFASSGNAQQILGEGWSLQESGHIWSVGARATVTLPILPASDDYLLEMDVIAFTIGRYLPMRRLKVSVNGIALQDADISDRVTMGVRLPRACLEGFDALSLVFDTPVCPPASVLGVGTDDRPLGIGFIALRIRRQSFEPMAAGASTAKSAPVNPLEAAGSDNRPIAERR